MASAFRDAHGYIASFRGFLRAGRQRKSVRVPRERLIAGDEQASADAYAKECDAACRLLESARTPGNIRRARELGAITKDQAEALHARAPVAPETPNALKPLSVLDAARMHPSSHRETVGDTTAAVRHERELKTFLTFAGISLVAEVTLEQVQRYVDHMAEAGVSWDGRRHRLLWLRRATRMAATRGIPDVIGELTLDRRPVAAPGLLGYWTLDELARGALSATDPRVRACIGLGGFCGLRPSEIFAAEPGDVDAGMLWTGRKNQQSRRLLPLPGIVREWIKAAVGKRTTGKIVETRGTWGHGRGEFTEASFAYWLTPHLETATGKRLPPKYLRKSFSTWCFRTKDLPTQHVEAYLGHKTALASLITGRHYLADLVARELIPTGERIDEIALAALARAAVEAKSERRGLRRGSTKSQGQKRQRA